MDTIFKELLYVAGRTLEALCESQVVLQYVPLWTFFVSCPYVACLLEMKTDNNNVAFHIKSKC